MTDTDPSAAFVGGDDIHPEAVVAPGYLATHAARAFNRLVDAQLRQHGLSLAQIGPLLLLNWKGPLLQRDIVRLSAVKQPAMVALLDKLESAGLVTRTRAPDDRRAALVSLTEKGREAACIGGDLLRDLNRAALAGFTDAEAAALTDLLGRVAANLDHLAGELHQK